MAHRSSFVSSVSPRRTRPSPLRPSVAAIKQSLLTGTAVALVLGCVADGPAHAQSATSQPLQLPQVSVEGGETSGGDYKADQSTLPKLTEPLRDTPQSITVVPAPYMQDRGVTNTSDAIRNVPGISLAAGEAGAQGNSLSLRGFTARNDIFLDGMRDFGSYYRDPFDLDEIEVLKGPSSILFGRGSTGGVVNQVSKTPFLDSQTAGSVVFGTDNTKRATIDFNRPIPALGQGAALRLNAMVNDSQVADRRIGEYYRYGFAPSLSLGLGTPTRLTISYIHQAEDDIPDYGIPFLFGKPAPVARHSYYGFESGNYLRTEADIGTVKFEHDFSPALTFRNQFRYAEYHRSARITEAQIPNTVTPATPLENIIINRNQITVDSEESFLDNQSDVTMRFTTGGIRHTLVTGIEASRETSDPTRSTYTGVPGTSLVAPDPTQPFAGTATITSQVRTTAVSVGAYALDTLKLSDQWELTGGVRWDRFDTQFNQLVAPTSAFDRVDEMPSWRASIVYKPLPNGSIYFAYGTSFNPSAESLSLSTANANLPPEENETYEVGSKWDLLSANLSLRGAIYRTEKTNARVTDPDNPLLNINGGDQRVDGFEIEAIGRLTERWQVYGGYNFMLSKVVKSSTAPNAPPVGAPLTNAPKHSFNVWTTYEATKDIEIGGGITYVSSRVARNTPPFSTVPDYWTADAMAKYRLTEHVNLQLNIINIADTYYIDQIHPAHVVPGAGRTVLFTTNYRF